MMEADSRPLEKRRRRLAATLSLSSAARTTMKQLQLNHQPSTSVTRQTVNVGGMAGVGDPLVIRADDSDKLNQMERILRTLGRRSRPRRARKLSNAAQLKQTQQGVIDLHTPDSILTRIQIRSLLTRSTFCRLPSLYQLQLARMLPESDGHTANDGLMKLGSASLSNELLARGCLHWQQRLSKGEFTHDNQNKHRAELESRKRRLDPWKARNFEPVWGRRRVRRCGSPVTSAALAALAAPLPPSADVAAAVRPPVGRVKRSWVSVSLYKNPASLQQHCTSALPHDGDEECSSPLDRRRPCSPYDERGPSPSELNISTVGDWTSSRHDVSTESTDSVVIESGLDDMTLMSSDETITTISITTPPSPAGSEDLPLVRLTSSCRRPISSALHDDTDDIPLVHLTSVRCPASPAAPKDTEDSSLIHLSAKRRTPDFEEEYDEYIVGDDEGREMGMPEFLPHYSSHLANSSPISSVPDSSPVPICSESGSESPHPHVPSSVVSDSGVLSQRHIPSSAVPGSGVSPQHHEPLSPSTGSCVSPHQRESTSAFLDSGVSPHCRTPTSAAPDSGVSPSHDEPTSPSTGSCVFLQQHESIATTAVVSLPTSPADGAEVAVDSSVGSSCSGTDGQNDMLEPTHPPTVVEKSSYPAADAAKLSPRPPTGHGSDDESHPSVTEDSLSPVVRCTSLSAPAGPIECSYPVSAVNDSNSPAADASDESVISSPLETAIYECLPPAVVMEEPLSPVTLDESAVSSPATGMDESLVSSSESGDMSVSLLESQCYTPRYPALLQSALSPPTRQQLLGNASPHHSQLAPAQLPSYTAVTTPTVPVCFPVTPAAPGQLFTDSSASQATSVAPAVAASSQASVASLFTESSTAAVQAQFPGSTSTTVNLQLPGSPSTAVTARFSGSPLASVNTQLAGSPSASVNTQFAGSPSASVNTQLGGSPSASVNTQLAGSPSASVNTQLAGSPSVSFNTQLAGSPSATVNTQLTGSLSATVNTQLTGSLSAPVTTLAVVARQRQPPVLPAVNTNTPPVFATNATPSPQLASAAAYSAVTGGVMLQHQMQTSVTSASLVITSTAAQSTRLVNRTKPRSQAGRIRNTRPPAGSVNLERSYQICQAVIAKSQNRAQLQAQMRPLPRLLADNRGRPGTPPLRRIGTAAPSPATTPPLTAAHTSAVPPLTAAHTPVAPPLTAAHVLTTPPLAAAHMQTATSALATPHRHTTPPLTAVQRLVAPSFGAVQRHTAPHPTAAQRHVPPHLTAVQRHVAPPLTVAQRHLAPSFTAAQRQTAPHLSAAQRHTAPHLSAAQRHTAPHLSAAQRYTSGHIAAAHRHAVPPMPASGAPSAMQVKYLQVPGQKMLTTARVVNLPPAAAGMGGLCDQTGGVVLGEVAENGTLLLRKDLLLRGRQKVYQMRDSSGKTVLVMRPAAAPSVAAAAAGDAETSEAGTARTCSSAPPERCSSLPVSARPSSTGDPPLLQYSRQPSVVQQPPPPPRYVSRNQQVLHIQNSPNPTAHCDCGLKPLVVCHQCGAYCHDDCVYSPADTSHSQRTVCSSCLTCR